MHSRSIYRISLLLYRIIRLFLSYLKQHRQRACRKKSRVEMWTCNRDTARMITILVIGRVGAGKSELVNSMFEAAVKAGTCGTPHVTRATQFFEGEREGVKIRIYDAVGFEDKLTGGKSHRSVLLDVAKLCDHFDLILICEKLYDAAAEAHRCYMFSELASYLHKEMWKKTIVVFTFANMYIQCYSVRKFNDLETQVQMQVNQLKASIINSLADYSIKNLEDIPFCIAGSLDERKLPTVDDWLGTLWSKCIDRYSDCTCPFLSFYLRNQGFVKAGTVLGSVGAGAGIGAAVGSVIPVAGTAIGAGVGGVVGASVSLVGIVVKCINN